MDRFVFEQVRAAVATPLVIALSALASAVIVWRTISVPTGWLLASLAAGLVVAAVVGAALAQQAAQTVQKAQGAELNRVTAAAAALDKAVVWSAEELVRGGTVALPESLPPFEEAGPADEAVAQLAELQVQAVAALIRVRDESQSAVLLSMLHQFARREHALVSRALEKLDLLQERTDDPDLLEVIFTLDHLVTGLRRWVESKAVVAGESLRAAREPVSVMQVLRGANQEILYYARVTVAAGTVGAELGLPRHVGPDLTHLLAELVENATKFSDPATKVQVRAYQVAKGLAIEIEDRVAIPMRPEDRARWNRLLADPDQVDVTSLVKEGRIGLLTAATIAHRHGISIHLTENPTGGTTALVVVPGRLLVSLTPPAAPPAPPAQPPTRAAAQPHSHPVQPTPASHRQTSTPVAGAADAAPPLPQRVVSERAAAPAPTRPRPAATRPRYGMAGAFRSGIGASRAPEALPSAEHRPSGAVPPTTQP
ncbi:sensor histidine kinase [Streptomyces lanatus]|uniref:histidine kinase n=1 Tax=Streptomyces lanatus TaxID=66900 RepID=A0ABV1Y003_9ACTN|nr:ATP-binding protein [Streptomyces lanatus]GHH22176.1 histidine kinase [Streptomyces lanatus]